MNITSETAIASNIFGMTFWLDDNNDFCYCPTFINNEPDLDCWGYVSEWTEFEGVNLDELFSIHRQLILNKGV